MRFGRDRVSTVTCSRSATPLATTYAVSDSPYTATVIQVVGKDQYKIHYDNYEAKWDEVVGPARIRGRR